jgi:hypothetical protein
MGEEDNLPDLKFYSTDFHYVNIYMLFLIDLHLI